MLKYATLINKETGLCAVAIGTDEQSYIEMGMKLLDVEQSDIDYFWYLTEKCPKKSELDKKKERKAEFEKNFFETSLGYIRRTVTMSNGDTKDFLSDLLPSISMGLQLNQPITIIAYDKPTFLKDIKDWTIYQKKVLVTPEFIMECFQQLSNDFFI